MAAGLGQEWSINTALGEDDLGRLYEILYPVRRNYLPFGLQIGVKLRDIQNVDVQQTDTGHHLLGILSVRVRQTPALTWAVIDKALRSQSVGEHQLADSIREYHGKSSFEDTLDVSMSDEQGEHEESSLSDDDMLEEEPRKLNKKTKRSKRKNDSMCELGEIKRAGNEVEKQYRKMISSPVPYANKKAKGRKYKTKEKGWKEDNQYRKESKEKSNFKAKKNQHKDNIRKKKAIEKGPFSMAELNPQLIDIKQHKKQVVPSTESEDEGEMDISTFTFSSMASRKCVPKPAKGKEIKQNVVKLPLKTSPKRVCADLDESEILCPSGQKPKGSKIEEHLYELSNSEEELSEDPSSVSVVKEKPKAMHEDAKIKSKKGKGTCKEEVFEKTRGTHSCFHVPL